MVRFLTNEYAMVVKLVYELRAYMSKILTLVSFKQVVTNKQKEVGYFSFKREGYEICLDKHIRHGWLVCFCNRFEEVVDEVYCRTQKRALEKANEYYGNRLMLMIQ